MLISISNSTKNNSKKNISCYHKIRRLLILRNFKKENSFDPTVDWLKQNDLIGLGVYLFDDTPIEKDIQFTIDLPITCSDCMEITYSVLFMREYSTKGPIPIIKKQIPVFLLKEIVPMTTSPNILSILRNNLLE